MYGHKHNRRHCELGDMDCIQDMGTTVERLGIITASNPKCGGIMTNEQTDKFRDEIVQLMKDYGVKIVKYLSVRTRPPRLLI